MNDDVSLISMHPFFQRFVFSIIQTIKEKDLELSDKFVVDADLVPKVSEKVMMASMGAGVVVPIAKEPKPVTPFSYEDMNELIAPIGNRFSQKMRPSMEIKQPTPRQPAALRQAIAPPAQTRRATPTITPGQVAPAVTVPIVAGEGDIDKDKKYGKISPLLNDASVSTIECLGEGKEIMIIRTGQKQRTRIVLDKKEIKEVLNKVADDAHIPLLEGVFRASVKGFSINAVVSEMVSPRFVIKKATAYGLLE